MKQTVFFNGTNCFLLMKQTVLHIETNRSPKEKSVVRFNLL